MLTSVIAVRVPHSKTQKVVAKESCKKVCHSAYMQISKDNPRPENSRNMAAPLDVR